MIFRAVSLSTLLLATSSFAQPKIVCDILPPSHGTVHEAEYVPGIPTLTNFKYKDDIRKSPLMRTPIFDETFTCFANTPSIGAGTSCKVTNVVTTIPGDSVGRHDLKFDCATFSGQLLIEGQKGISFFHCGLKTRNIVRQYRMTNCRSAN